MEDETITNERCQVSMGHDGASLGRKRERTFIISVTVSFDVAAAGPDYSGGTWGTCPRPSAQSGLDRPSSARLAYRNNCFQNSINRNEGRKVENSLNNEGPNLKIAKKVACGAEKSF